MYINSDSLIAHMKHALSEYGFNHHVSDSVVQLITNFANKPEECYTGAWGVGDVEDALDLLLEENFDGVYGEVLDYDYKDFLRIIERAINSVDWSETNVYGEIQYQIEWFYVLSHAPNWLKLYIPTREEAIEFAKEKVLNTEEKAAWYRAVLAKYKEFGINGKFGK